jgi:hypothetical protein
VAPKELDFTILTVLVVRSISQFKSSRYYILQLVRSLGHGLLLMLGPASSGGVDIAASYCFPSRNNDDYGPIGLGGGCGLVKRAWSHYLLKRKIMCIVSIVGHSRYHLATY